VPEGPAFSGRGGKHGQADGQPAFGFVPRVRRSDGNISVADGPFTEAKEVVCGYAPLKADSKEEAIDLACQFLKVAGNGECELRQLYEPNSRIRFLATRRRQLRSGSKDGVIGGCGNYRNSSCD
jgi:hypothetical protein